jgi:Zn-dependent protease
MHRDSPFPDDEPIFDDPLTDLERDVLAQLEIDRNKQSSWWNALVILIVSMMFFAGADGGWNSLLILIPILLFHELGHYLTMRFFGYRNLKMFFIPFFGAAVSGRHYNVQGWKKAVVALMGPLPGIVLGGGLGAAALATEQRVLFDIAAPMLLLNAFNLLPLMPFDGGWVLHAVLFCRHPLFDLAFRVVTVAALVGLGLVLGPIFYVLAGLTAIGIPIAWRVANAAHRLRQADAIPASLDDTVPPETARVILRELVGDESMHTNYTSTNVAVLAQQVSDVFETLNARPPGVAASIGLLAIHGGAFVASVVIAVLLFVGHGLNRN